LNLFLSNFTNFSNFNNFSFVSLYFSIKHFIQARVEVIVIGLQRAQILGNVHETHVAEHVEVFLESVHALRQFGHFFEILDLLFVLFIKTFL